jgi:hypothetical protein
VQSMDNTILTFTARDKFRQNKKKTFKGVFWACLCVRACVRECVLLSPPSLRAVSPLPPRSQAT